MQKYVQNYADNPNQYEMGITETLKAANKPKYNYIDGPRKDIDQINGLSGEGFVDNQNEIGNTIDNINLDKEGVRAILQSMLVQAVGDDLRLKILDKIIALDNLKKEQTDQDDSTVHIYLPHKECPNCPQLKVCIDK